MKCHGCIKELWVCGFFLGAVPHLVLIRVGSLTNYGTRSTFLHIIGPKYGFYVVTIYAHVRYKKYEMCAIVSQMHRYVPV